MGVRAWSGKGGSEGGEGREKGPRRRSVVYTEPPRLIWPRLGFCRDPLGDSEEAAGRLMVALERLDLGFDPHESRSVAKSRVRVV